MPYLLKEMGFEGVIINRISTPSKVKRREQKELEFYWHQVRAVSTALMNEKLTFFFLIRNGNLPKTDCSRTYSPIPTMISLTRADLIVKFASAFI